MEDKKTYLQKMADKLVEWDRKIEDLKKRGNEAASIMKEDYVKMAEDLKVKKKTAEEKLAQLKSAGEEGWDELKRGADRAVSELSEAVTRALSKFRQKPL